MEKTLVLIKPDGVQRALIGKIMARFEERGLQLAAMKLIHMSPELAAQHYAEHEGKPFYKDLVGFITSGPVVAMVWQGMEAISVVRKMMGKTDPLEAAPGTIRGDYGIFMGNNLVHGSDSEESAEREISLFFNEAEVINYKLDSAFWVYGK